jgi:REP element-mobilizing transposase RayT
MPRRARLDVPGTLHHVIVRGIEGRRIVNDVADRKNFVKRLGKLAVDAKTGIYAWTIMTNHAHILLRSSERGLSDFMRRLLTGYAVSYNRRHRRSGERELSDDRILGRGEFVERIIKEAEAKIKFQLPVSRSHQKINEYITKVCKNGKVSLDELKGGSRRKEVSGVRSRIAIELVKGHGVALAEVARRVGVSSSAISKILKRAG